MPLAGDASIWICPQLTGAPNSFGNLFGYAMNMALSVRDAFQPDRIDKIGSPATMVFMARRTGRVLLDRAVCCDTRRSGGVQSGAATQRQGEHRVSGRSCVRI